MRALREGETYHHLGIPTDFQVRQTPISSIEELVQDLYAVDGSLLAPWQKFDAVATFVLPRLDFMLRGAHVEKGPLKEADKVIRRLAKGWMNLPQRASAELVYLPPNQGGRWTAAAERPGGRHDHRPRLQNVDGGGFGGPGARLGYAAGGRPPEDQTSSHQRGRCRLPVRQNGWGLQRSFLDLRLDVVKGPISRAQAEDETPPSMGVERVQRRAELGMPGYA